MQEETWEQFDPEIRRALEEVDIDNLLDIGFNRAYLDYKERQAYGEPW